MKEILFLEFHVRSEDTHLLEKLQKIEDAKKDNKDAIKNAKQIIKLLKKLYNLK